MWMENDRTEREASPHAGKINMKSTLSLFSCCLRKKRDLCFVILRIYSKQEFKRSEICIPSCRFRQTISYGYCGKILTLKVLVLNIILMFNLSTGLKGSF